MAEKLCQLKKKGGGGGVSAIVPSGYFNYMGAVVQSPLATSSSRGFGTIAGVQNATSLTISQAPYANLYKIKADGTVDYEVLSISAPHTFDVTNYDIVFIQTVSGSNFTAVCTIS